ncbi:phosphodiesterase [Enterovirga rhinocerotis]|uniref:3',5'-cyclic AMP phosphodiesterase CpdA n=1 Tax=Enterovirga rhinocerotis TaxID=1339210 RepID=A0A4V3DYK7_9HYPH|nr:phosphodiesterase [Enterovirga rhinocerotis]TDR93049.1 3',5'-cyclic AMP phosphodiesterase CpdA [Enterovirga rhinocerotis]
MLIAHISDLHARPKGALAYGVSETNLYAEHAVHSLLRLDPAPDCVLITGDLTDCGLDEEYDVVAGLLARLPCPVYAVPGNHDRREPFRRAFAQQAYLPEAGPLNFAVSCGDVRIIGLDSLVAGQSHGALEPDTISFLERSLAAEPNAPALVMLHHPPFDTGIAHMDRTRLLTGADELKRIVSANPQVHRILCGHVHRSIQQMFGGTLCQIAPSVGHQVMLDLRDDGPSCFVLEPAGFLLHRFAHGEFVTHLSAVERAPGPFPFILPDDYPGHRSAA